MNDREKNIIETLREGNRELRAECMALQAKLKEQQEWISKLEKAVDDACQKIASLPKEN